MEVLEYCPSSWLVRVASNMGYPEKDSQFMHRWLETHLEPACWPKMSHSVEIM